MKKNNKDLSHYFETARKQPPVISADEIAGIIQQPVAGPVSQAPKPASFRVLPKFSFISTGAAASFAVVLAFISVGVAASLAVKEIGPGKLLLLGSNMTIIHPYTTVVKDLQVYPNPTSEWLNLQMGFTEQVDVKISLRNLRGKPIKILQHFRPISELYAFYVADIVPGNYLLVVEPIVGMPYRKRVVIK